ncbi:MAG: histidinol-phosphate transaminase, partial [Bacillota bacterium]|nr:histidinol-phosphate transaminase [Bacillota bacterium]
MSRFLSSRLTSLKAYAPGEQPQDKAYIKLNTNESPYPPSALTQKAVEGESAFLHLYPDPECRELTKLLAEKNGLLPEQVLCSNGSDDILSYIFQAFGDGESGFAFPDISYGFYQVYGDFYGVPCCRIPLREDFSLCSEDYFALGCGIILANPNAQTGLMLSMEEIAAIAKKNPEHVLVVDEAYVDFAGESAVCLLSCYENIIIVRTFSKSRSLAGGRLGYALAGQELILDLKQIKYSTNPYSVNRMSQAAGLAALHDEEYYL